MEFFTILLLIFLLLGFLAIHFLLASLSYFFSMFIFIMLAGVAIAGIAYFIYSMNKFRNVLDILKKLIFSIIIFISPTYFWLITGISGNYIDYISGPIRNIEYQSYKGLLMALLFCFILMLVLGIIEIICDDISSDERRSKKRRKIKYLNIYDLVSLIIGVIFSVIYFFSIQNYYYNARLERFDINPSDLEKVTIKESNMLYVDMNHKYEAVFDSTWLFPSYRYTTEDEVYTVWDHYQYNGSETYIGVYSKKLNKWGYIPKDSVKYID